MISGLDHVVVLVNDGSAAASAYQTLFARTPAWQHSGEGADRVLFTLDNMTVELMAPAGDGAAAERIRAVIAAQGEGLASLCFRTHDIAKMHRRLDRLALKSGAGGRSREPRRDIERNLVMETDPRGHRRHARNPAVLCGAGEANVRCRCGPFRHRSPPWTMW